MHAIYTNRSQFGQRIINEDHELFFRVKKYDEEFAREQGYKFAHLFERKVDDYDQVYYEYVTSVIL